MSSYVISCCSTADLTKEHFAKRNISYICFHYELNGKEYAATGKRKIILIKEDGTLDLTAAAFAEGNKFEIEVTARRFPLLMRRKKQHINMYMQVLPGLSIGQQKEFRRQEATLVRMKLTVAKKVIKALLML